MKRLFNNNKTWWDKVEGSLWKEYYNSYYLIDSDAYYIFKNGVHYSILIKLIKIRNCLHEAVEVLNEKSV